MRGAITGATKKPRILKRYFLGLRFVDFFGLVWAAFSNTLKTSPRFGTGISWPVFVFCVFVFLFVMANYRTRIFCNRNDSKPSREDIFAQWIARELPKGTYIHVKSKEGKYKPFTLQGKMGLISK